MKEYIEGLCSTCRYSSKCAIIKDPLQDIQFCEEYDAAAFSGKGKKNATAANPRMEGPCPKGAGCRRTGNTALGLCGNCDNREGCPFPKPESGVWHCEEYL